MTRLAMLLVMLIGVTKACADDDLTTATPEKSPPKSFVIDLTRLVLTDDATESAANLHGAQLEEQIRKWRSADQIAVDETMSLTSVEHRESRVQFGRRVQMITGQSSMGAGRTATQSTTVSVGTLIRATVSSDDDRIAVELEYESSTLEPAVDEETLGEIATTTVTTQLRLKPGEPQVVTRSQGEHRIVLLVNVTEVGAGRATRRSSVTPSSDPRRPSFSRPSPSRTGRTSRPPSSAADRNERYMAFARAIFKRYDKNNDGVLDDDEADHLPGSFGDLDTNGDDKVTEEELMKFMKERSPQSRSR